MIDIDTVRDFFDNIGSTGNFNIKGELKWGYYFLSGDLRNLEKLKKHLLSEGYLFIDSFEAEKEEPSEDDEFYFHFEKIEHHTVESLMERNAELYKMAEIYNVEYDGFDVGN